MTAASPQRSSNLERLAAIDVGSNSIRLLVADWDPDSQALTVVDEVKAQPRLARGLGATGLLDEEAIEQALEALARMQEVAARRRVQRLAAVATSAVREAANGDAFVELVRERLGIPLEVIDQDTEARLSYRSIAHHFRLDERRTVTLDIGGGSLEAIGAVRGLIELTESLPLGTVRLTERYLTGARNSYREVRKLRKAVRRRLRKVTRWKDWRGAAVFGVGGSFTNLGRISAARHGLPTTAIHGITVTTAEVEHLLDWLVTLTPEERREVPGLNPQRADIILAGLAVSAELLALIDAPSVTVSAFGIREGLLLEMVGEDERPAGDPLKLARDFAIRCQCNPHHIDQVRHLAVELFNRLGGPLSATPEERPLLEAAALLHDVGHLVSYRRRHRHSYDLILHADRVNLSARERQIVALIARYHRKAGPGRKDPDFMALSKADRAIVRRLTALVRIADGLDRGYTSAVERLRIRLGASRLRITPVPRQANADLSLECWGARKRTDVLEELLNRPVVVAPPGRLRS